MFLFSLLKLLLLTLPFTSPERFWPLRNCMRGKSILTAGLSAWSVRIENAAETAQPEKECQYHTEAQSRWKSPHFPFDFRRLFRSKRERASRCGWPSDFRVQAYHTNTSPITAGSSLPGVKYSPVSVWCTRNENVRRKNMPFVLNDIERKVRMWRSSCLIGENING